MSLRELVESNPLGEYEPGGLIGKAYEDCKASTLDPVQVAGLVAASSLPLRVSLLHHGWNCARRAGQASSFLNFYYDVEPVGKY